MNGDSGDSFPGTSEVTSFNFNGWYDRNVFGFAYVDETEGGDARFLLSGSSYKLDNPQISISDIRGRSAKATWTSVKYAKSYNVTLMQNGKARRASLPRATRLSLTVRSRRRSTRLWYRLPWPTMSLTASR